MSRREMDFNIRPASRSCAVTGRLFHAGDACWSVLVEQEGRLIRRDYSLEAWQGPPADAVGYWRTTVQHAAEPGRPRLDADSLFEYFVQLNDSPNSVQQQYRYVLALLLLRKRRLVLEEVIEQDDRPTMRLVGTSGEGPFDVPEEDLSEEQIQRLQHQLFDTGRNAA